MPRPSLRILQFLLLLILVLGTPVSSTAQVENDRVSEALLFNGEPFLAVDPANAQNVVVAWMGYSARSKAISITVRTSSDGGATWSSATEMQHFGNGWTSADVSLAWHRTGDLYLCYIDSRQASDSGGVYVARSTDGGRTWSDPVEAIDVHVNDDQPVDRPWIAIDNSGLNSDGTLYIVTKPPSWNALPNHTYFTRSLDEGKTWSRDTMLDEHPFSASLITAPMGSPTVATDGRLYIAYPSADPGNIGYALATSADGGASFTRSFILRPQVVKDTLVKNGFHLLADPSDPTHLLFVWPDVRNGDNDIYAATSFDRGASWSDPVRVNDDAIGNGVVQDMLWPAIGTDSTVAIVWRDRRNGSGTGYASASDTYYAISRDGGRSFSSNLRLSDSTAPYQQVLASSGNDFLSAALARDTLYATWADTRTGTLQIYFGKVAVGGTNWVSVEPLSQGPELAISSDPATLASRINVRLDAPSNCKVSLLASNGTLASSLFDGTAASSFDIALPPSLATGTYFIEARTNTGLSVLKFVLRR